MLLGKERWTIFEDVEDEVAYLRRRGDVLAQGLHASRAEVEGLHEAGLRLQDAHEALQLEVREVAGDAAYWKALAEARAEDLATTKASLATVSSFQQASNWKEEVPGSPLAGTWRATSPSSSRRKSSPGSLWGIPCTRSLRAFKEAPTEAVRPAAPKTAPSEPNVQPEADSTKQVEGSQVVEVEVEAKTADSQNEAEQRKEVQASMGNLDKENEPPSEFENLREVLRAAAREAAQVESKRSQKVLAAKSQPTRSFQQIPSDDVQQTKSALRPSTSPPPLPEPRQDGARLSSMTAQPATVQTKGKSLGRPSRLSMAGRARRESVATRTPPRHRTPPPQHLLTKSPGAACMTSPLAFPSARSTAGGVRRALFSPNSSSTGAKKWGVGGQTRRHVGLGSPSRRSSKAY